LTAAQVPKGSFYHYFKSKELFGEALLEDYFNTYLVQIDDLLSESGKNSAQRFMSYWQAWLNASMLAEDGESTQCQCLAVKLGAEVSDLSETMRLSLQQGTDQIIAKLAACIEAGRSDGSLASDLVPKESAQMLYQMWLGASLLSKIRRSPEALSCAMSATRQFLRL